MINDPINHYIEVLKQEDGLSASTLNELHAATSGHRWCEGRSLPERVLMIRCIMAGRILSANGHNALYQIERKGYT